MDAEGKYCTVVAVSSSKVDLKLWVVTPFRVANYWGSRNCIYTLIILKRGLFKKSSGEKGVARIKWGSQEKKGVASKKRRLPGKKGVAREKMGHQVKRGVARLEGRQVKRGSPGKKRVAM